jgi:hypothetical protein
MAGGPKSDDEKSKKEAAESLSHQIDEIVSGRPKAGAPETFRDFIERKMAEDRGKPAGSAAGPSMGEKPKTSVPDKTPQRRG